MCFVNSSGRVIEVASGGAEQTWEKSFTWEAGRMQTLFDPIVLFVFTLVAAGVVRSSPMTSAPVSPVG